MPPDSEFIVASISPTSIWFVFAAALLLAGALFLLTRRRVARHAPDDHADAPVDRTTELARAQRREWALALLVNRDRAKPFEEAAAEALSVGLGYRWAGIGEFEPEAKRATFLALWDRDHLVAPMSYDLAGTPCEKLFECGGFCHVLEGVTERFPEDALLREMGAVSYQSAPIFDETGATIGLVVAFDDRADESAEGDHALLKLIADWAAVELGRHAAESARRESEARLADFAAASSDWLWETDEDFRFTRFFSAGDAGTGEELMRRREGRTPFEISSAKMTPEDAAALRADIAARRPFRNFPYPMVGKDGRTVTYRANGRPFFDAAGRFAGYRGTAVDISAQIEAEARAHHADAVLREAIEGIDDGFLIFDAEDRLVLCNSKILEYYPLAAAKIVPGMSFEELARVVAESGQVVDADTDTEGWVSARLERHRNANRPEDQELCDGRWLRVRDQRLPNGWLVGTRVDITRLKTHEAELARQTALMQATLDNMQEGLTVFDADLKLLASNRIAHEILEFPAEMMEPGRPLEDFIRLNAERGEYGPGDTEEQVRERMALAWRMEPHCFERARPDGIVIEVRGNPMPGGGFVTTYADVTHRKKAEEALRASEERYALASAGANEGIWDWDIASNEAYLSPRLMMILGFGGTEMRTTPEDWHKRLHPDDRAPYIAAIIAHLKGETDHFEFEYRIRDKAGAYLWVHDRGIARRGADGRAYRMAGSLGDVTERKRAEEALRNAEAKYRRIFEQAVEGLYQATIEGRYLSVNPAMARILGFDSPEQLVAEQTDIGRQLYADPGRRKEFLGQLEKDGAVHGLESRARRRGGGVIWISESARLVRDDTGQPLHIEGVFTDITERKQIMQELRKAKEQAELASRTKGQFLANMSHELRTPLNAIIGFSEIMMKEMFGPIGHPGYREYAKDINDSGDHLLNLINDILDVSKAEAGRIELLEARIEVKALIDSSLRLVRERAESGRVRLSVDVADPLPTIQADELRLKQILLNLLTNAVKFTPEGGSVTINARVAPGGGFAISVTDTGIGMKKEDIPRALEAFSQIDGKLDRKYEGTGLGLPLTKALIELHGGTLTVESTPDQGTTVTVDLPADRVLAERMVS